MSDRETTAFTRQKGFPCPHCHEQVSIPIHIQLGEPQKVESEAETSHPRYGLSVDQCAMLDRADATGVLSAFGDTVRRVTAQSGTPKSLEKFFLTFLSHAVQKRVPDWVVRYFYRELGGTLQFWSAYNVIAVISDGVVRWFVPQDHVLPKTVRSLFGAGAAGVMKASIGSDQLLFHEWVKTRHGYVPAGAQLFLDELQQRSVGDFANVRL